MRSAPDTQPAGSTDIQRQRKANGAQWVPVQRISVTSNQRFADEGSPPWKGNLSQTSRIVDIKSRWHSATDPTRSFMTKTRRTETRRVASCLPLMESIQGMLRCFGV